MTDQLPEKKKAGRPSVYKETYPEDIIQLMKAGYKDCQIWAAWGIGKDTFYRWLRENPALKEAHEQGLSYCEAFWEQKGIELMNNSDNRAFNYWIAFMNRKFGWHKKGDDSGTTININNMNVFQDKDKSELIDYITSELEDLHIIDVTDDSIVHEVEPQLKMLPPDYESTE